MLKLVKGHVWRDNVSVAYIEDDVIYGVIDSRRAVAIGTFNHRNQICGIVQEWLASSGR